jgi:hypothetical protein
MHAAVDDEPPPANLLASVMARHRRRRTRIAVAGAALVAVGVLALPPAVSALHGNWPGSRPTAEPGPHRAAPGTVLDNCDSSVGAQLPLGWRNGSVAVGPLWFVGLRQATAAFYGHSKLAIGELTVNIRDGATAWVKVVGPAAGHFRFLFGPDDFQYGPGGRRYTLADGENGVTLAGCLTGSGSLSVLPGFTEFSGRYLIDKIPTRVSLDIRTPASPRPTRITFRVGY